MRTIPPLLVSSGSRFRNPWWNEHPLPIFSEFSLLLPKNNQVPPKVWPSHPAGGLDDSINLDTMRKLLKVDSEEWLKEVTGIRSYYEQFGSRLPQALKDELSSLEQRLKTYEPVPTTNQRIMNWVKQVRDCGSAYPQELSNWLFRLFSNNCFDHYFIVAMKIRGCICPHIFIHLSAVLLRAVE